MFKLRTGNVSMSGQAAGGIGQRLKAAAAVWPCCRLLCKLQHLIEGAQIPANEHDSPFNCLLWFRSCHARLPFALWQVFELLKQTAKS